MEKEKSTENQDKPRSLPPKSKHGSSKNYGRSKRSSGLTTDLPTIAKGTGQIDDGEEVQLYNYNQCEREEELQPITTPRVHQYKYADHYNDEDNVEGVYQKGLYYITYLLLLLVV